MIRNIGPIKSVDIDLNRITVLIGPQSSGKSTVAKIISYCSWFEKQTILATKIPNDFFSELLSFHNFDKEYFSMESLIDYESDWCHIHFEGDGNKGVKVKVFISSQNIFHNKKIQYIPAERSLVTISGIGRYNEARNNVWGYLNDWIEAKNNHPGKPQSVPIHSLGIASYLYDKDLDSDYVILPDKKRITLQHSSSGLVSALPLLLVFDYSVNVIYTKERIQSPFEIINIKSKVDLLSKENQELFLEIMNEMKTANMEVEKLEGDMKSVFSKQLRDIQKRTSMAIGFDTDYNMSEVIIEEPELNLFPSTQQELVYYMIRSIMHPQRSHQLVLTTHSPYILFAINNCVLGGLVEAQIPDNIKDSFMSRYSWVNPKEVSLYEIHNGELVSIQEEDGLLKNNYLNQAYRDNSSEYLSLLGYYGRTSRE